MRLVIDNKENLDTNNMYLPETGGGGTPATGGAITIDSVTVDDTPASVSFTIEELSLSYPYDADVDIFDIFIEEATVPANKVLGLTGSFADAAAIATGISGATNLLSADYTVSVVGTTITITANNITTNDGTGKVEITCNQSNGEFSFRWSGGYTPAPEQLYTIDGGTPVILSTDGQVVFPYNGGFYLFVNGSYIATTPFTTYNNRNEVLAALNTVMAGNPNYTFTNPATNMFTLITTANRNTGHVVEIGADSMDILYTGKLSGGANPSSIAFNIGGNPLVTLSASNGGIDSTDTPTTVANKIRIGLNALSQFSPDGVTNVGGALTLATTIGTDEFNTLPITITESGDGSITTSGMTPLSGGIDDVASITPTLASINKSRKSYFDGTKAYIKGFGGFILIDETPVSQDNQTDFFALARNKVTVDASNGIGFTHRIESIASESFYFVNAFRINGSNQISDTLSEHLWLRIKRNASDNLEIDLCTLTGKTTANGWEFSVAQNLVTNADGLAYVADRYLRWIYPQSGATITQFITLSDLSTVTDYVNVTGTPLTALNTLLDGNTFTLPHVAGNVGSDAVLTVIRADGE